MNNKNTKRALLTSVLSLAVCGSMLVGTTFAWFTDSVSSTNNVITTGNLDVELYYKTKLEDDWALVEDEPLFDESILWEPGRTEVVYLKVVNAGSLSLKYRLGIDVTNETKGENAEGEFALSDYLYTGLAWRGTDENDERTWDTYETREDYEAWATTKFSDVTVDMTSITALGYKFEPTLDAKEEDEMAIVVTMPETVGNEANYVNGKAPKIEFGVHLVATQSTLESDSFDNYYDANATYTAEIDRLRSLLANAKAGDVVEYSLTHDAYVTETIKVPEGVTLNLDGNGHTMIMNLGGAGFYAYRADLTIKNMNIIGSAQCAIFTKGDRGIVDGQMVEYLVHPVFENVTVDMNKSDLAPLYFNGMGEAMLTNCTIKGAGYVRTNYVNGAHIFAGAEMKVTVNGGNIGVVFINANGESTTSIFGSGITVNSGVVEKIVLESDWREDQANNAAYTYNGGTVKEVVKVVDTGAELESVLKEKVYSVALSRDVTLEGHLSSSSMGDINIDGCGKTLSIRGIYGNNGANVTLSNMTLVDNNPADYTIYNQGGKIELNNVTYNSNINKAFQLVGGGDVILTDCNITGDPTGTYSASNIWCGDGRTVTVNGGTYGSIFMNVSEGANVLSASKITVNAGTIGKLILETEKNTDTGDGKGYKSATLVQNGGTITTLVENPQGYDLTGLEKLN